MPFDLSTLESRFWHDLDTVDSDAEAALHSKIVDTVVTAAKVILPLVPDGVDVETLLTKLDEVAAEAHKVVSAHEEAVSPTVDSPDADVAPEGAVVTPPEQAPEPQAPEPSSDPTDQPGPPARPI